MAKKKSRKPAPKNVEVASAPKEQINYAWKLVRKGTRFLRGLQSGEIPFSDGVEMDEVRAKCRVTSCVKMVETVQALVEGQCSFEQYKFYELWLRQNLSLVYSLDYAEHANHCLTAAALWMLDQMREAGTFSRACQVLPMDDRIYTELDMPNIWDVSHETEAITRLLWAIQHRNDDCVGVVAKKKSPYPRYFLDDYTAANQHKQDVTSRRVFEQLMSCVPQEKKEKALRLYEETYWDFARRICLSADVYGRRNRELDVRREELASDMMELADDVQNLESIDHKEWLEGGYFSAHMTQARRRLRALEGADAEILEEQRQNDDRFIFLHYDLGTILSLPEEERIARVGEEIAAFWEDLHIQDPYALCFGMLCAAELNSDLLWAYGVSVPLADLCGSMLPWKMRRMNEDEDVFWRNNDDGAEGDLPAVNMELPKRLRILDFPDWYALNHLNPAETHCKNNLAQIVYGLTGAVIPRNLERYKGALMELESFGITGKKATLPLLYCMLLLGEYGHRSHVDRAAEDLLEVKEESMEEADSIEELQKRIRNLERENDRLREVAYAAGREARENKERLESQAEELRTGRQELADLRELVFRQQEGIFETEVEEESTISFPYQVRSRVVVFGGHDSWAREIKPKLPNVRFVGRDMQPNATMIRHADVVWIQTNSLSHSYFYRIIDEVRRYKIPVRYFGYASATKCAEQLVRVDQGN